MLICEEPLIHVGLHKCASTWLQNILFSDPETGFAAPWGSMSHRAVTEFVTVDPLVFDADQTRRRFAEAADLAVPVEGKSIVISHEALSSRPHQGRYYAPSVADRMKAVFPKARILFIFREQRNILYSLYGEHIRNGFQSTLEEFLGTGQEPPGWTSTIQLSFFEYDRLLKMYQAVFGADRVLALPMELLKSDPELFTNRIFDFAGLPTRTVETRNVVYKSWSPLTTSVYRRTNGVIRKSALGGKAPFAFRARAALIRKFDRLVPESISTAREASMRSFIDNRTGTFFAESNQRLAKELQIDLARLGYVS
jgi:hypothetical protein